MIATGFDPVEKLAAVLLAFSFATLSPALFAQPAENSPVRTRSPRAYLFSSFRGNGEDGLHLAWSDDGFKWNALNGDKGYFKPLIGKEKLMRDPNIVQGPDSMFHMVWTASWKDHVIGHASSKDLINWSEQESIPVMEHEPTATNCWAPETIYDPNLDQFLIYWATTIPGRFTEANGTSGKYNHRIFGTITKDFKTFSKAAVFYDPGFSVIDSTIIFDGGKFYMISKDEREKPEKKVLFVSVAEKVNGPYELLDKPFSPSWVEGPTVTKIGNEFVVYFDEYTRHKYGAMKTKDFKTWTSVSEQLLLPKGSRHGTVFTVDREILDKLIARDETIKPAN